MTGTQTGHKHPMKRRTEGRRVMSWMRRPEPDTHFHPAGLLPKCDNLGH